MRFYFYQIGSRESNRQELVAEAAGVGGVRHRLRSFMPVASSLPPSLPPTQPGLPHVCFSMQAEVSFLNYENEPVGCLLYE